MKLLPNTLEDMAEKPVIKDLFINLIYECIYIYLDYENGVLCPGKLSNYMMCMEYHFFLLWQYLKKFSQQPLIIILKEKSSK